MDARPGSAGFFFCRRELIEKTRPLSVGWLSVVDAQNYGDYNYTLKPDASRFECGTHNVAGMLGFRASLDLLLSIGIDAISNRVKRLTDRLIEGLLEKGYRIISPRSGEQWSGIVGFVSPSHDSEVDPGKVGKENHIEIALRERRLRVRRIFTIRTNRSIG